MQQIASKCCHKVSFGWRCPGVLPALASMSAVISRALTHQGLRKSMKSLSCLVLMVKVKEENYLTNT